MRNYKRRGKTHYSLAFSSERQIDNRQDIFALIENRLPWLACAEEMTMRPAAAAGPPNLPPSNDRFCDFALRVFFAHYGDVDAHDEDIRASLPRAWFVAEAIAYDRMPWTDVERDWFLRDEVVRWLSLDLSSTGPSRDARAPLTQFLIEFI